VYSAASRLFGSLSAPSLSFASKPGLAELLFFAELVGGFAHPLILQRVSSLSSLDDRNLGTRGGTLACRALSPAKLIVNAVRQLRVLAVI
jgi:hypothetical protein